LMVYMHAPGPHDVAPLPDALSLAEKLRVVVG
jgi:hypothetical protein